MSKTVQGKTGAKQSAEKKKKKQQKKIVIVAVEVLVLLILAAVLFVVVKLSKIERDTDFNMEDVGINEGISSESQEIMAGYTTVALFGLDNRSNGNLSKGNSDVIMIASINNDTHEVKLVSVYRDSYLDTGGGTYKKCNSAYANGGPEQAVTMLNRNLDLDITDYVTVDFNAVVECVDLLGGVTIPEVTDDEAVLMRGYMDEINKLTKNDSQYLTSGGTNVEMDGVQACAYARIRYTAGDDYRRTERQRTVIAAMVEKAQKSNLKTINSLIDTETMTKLKYRAIVQWLLELDALTLHTNAAGSAIKRPTKMGRDLGIILEHRQGLNGTHAVVLYNLSAQHIIIDNLDAIIQLN